MDMEKWSGGEPAIFFTRRGASGIYFLCGEVPGLASTQYKCWPTAKYRYEARLRGSERKCVGRCVIFSVCSTSRPSSCTCRKRILDIRLVHPRWHHTLVCVWCGLFNITHRSLKVYPPLFISTVPPGLRGMILGRSKKTTGSPLCCCDCL